MSAKNILFILSLVLTFIFASCEQSDDIISKKRVLVTEPTLTEMEVWVNPLEGTSQSIPAFRGQWQDDKTYYLFAVDQYSHYGIQDFEFEEGYVYKLSVIESQYKNPPTEFLNRWFKLDKIISKTKAE